MATFTDRLRILVDWDSKSADTGIKGFTTSIKNADGAAGKFKAGWSSASESVKANAAALAATAGVALVGFAVKSVNAFRDIAIAAEDMGNATGLSTEQASRWIAVADDFNVSAETLQTSIGRIAKDLDADKWEKYGIATRDAAGNARDANSILIDVLDVLGQTSNETERARIGAELLGRGWQGVAPIIGKTRAEYEKMLSTVEDGQVITDEEAQKAREFDLAMDKLGDALKEAQYAFGQIIAEGVTPFIAGISKGIGKLGDLKEKMDDVSIAGFKLTDSLGGVTEKLWDNAIHGKNPFEDSADRLLTLAEAVAPAVDEMGEAADQAATNGLAALNAALEHQYEAAVNAANALYGVESAELSLMESAAELAAQQAETDAVLADSASTDAEKTQALIDLRQAQIGTAEQAIAVAEAFADEQGATEGSTASYGLQIQELERLQDTFPELRAEIQRYIDKLNAIPGVKSTHVQVTGLYGGISAGIGTGGRRAAGGPVAAGAPYMVGEKGPEMFVPGSDGGIVPNHALGGGGGGATFNFNGPLIGVSESSLQRWIVDALAAAKKDGLTGGLNL